VPAPLGRGGQDVDERLDALTERFERRLEFVALRNKSIGMVPSRIPNGN
jgi:hypothetical protein